MSDFFTAMPHLLYQKVNALLFTKTTSKDDAITRSKPDSLHTITFCLNTSYTQITNSVHAHCVCVVFFSTHNYHLPQEITSCFTFRNYQCMYGKDKKNQVLLQILDLDRFFDKEVQVFASFNYVETVMCVKVI